MARSCAARASGTEMWHDATRAQRPTPNTMRFNVQWRMLSSQRHASGVARGAPDAKKRGRSRRTMHDNTAH
eukprot:9949584-Lingulodinium_polyedra.AAC.1